MAERTFTATRTSGGSWYTIERSDGKSVMVSVNRGPGKGRHTAETAIEEGKKILESRDKLSRKQ